jgi:hypothetical protein
MIVSENRESVLRLWGRRRTYLQEDGRLPLGSWPRMTTLRKHKFV